MGQNRILAFGFAKELENVNNWTFLCPFLRIEWVCLGSRTHKDHWLAIYRACGPQWSSPMSEFYNSWNAANRNMHAENYRLQHHAHCTSLHTWNWQKPNRYIPDLSVIADYASSSSWQNDNQKLGMSLWHVEYAWVRLHSVRCHTSPDFGVTQQHSASMLRAHTLHAPVGTQCVQCWLVQIDINHSNSSYRKYFGGNPTQFSWKRYLQLILMFNVLGLEIIFPASFSSPSWRRGWFWCRGLWLVFAFTLHSGNGRVVGALPRLGDAFHFTNDRYIDHFKRKSVAK